MQAAPMKLQDIASDTLTWQIVSIKDDKILVREIQAGLRAQGLNPGAIDGLWGSATQRAYESFAKTQKLRTDELSPKAAQLLLKKPSTPQPTPQPTTAQPSPQAPRPIAPRPQPSGTTGGPRPAPQPTASPRPKPVEPKPQVPTAQPISKTLTASDYEAVARMIGCDVAAVRAVVQIESSGSGFLPDGRPKILFEAQWFGKFTNDQYNKTHPDISSLTWNPKLYVGGAREWDRLKKAMNLNPVAAIQSASWGLGQVMGFNFRIAGYSDLEVFVKDMHVSEGKQLMAMFNFIKNRNLGRHLISRDWAGFARGYNGEGYRQNRYDEKLAAAYRQWAGVA
ncbi:MAG: N-acetylmuramidase domain-containing protein [Leptolyngbyaceae bacterium]|nr:N-acetylmuramidase domain-containing protein [Leptolyngbyaceae bacterium]